LASASGIGLGRVFAARGLLAHLVRVEDGRVRDYRILAPTEWNFHPRGVVARALESLPPGPEEQLRRQAELLITAIDPCVAFTLTYKNAP
ncbi:nickel-dependent hydrogenase large subunit, partial [Thiocapsa sp.]|uniref:nickel-dependent hydrogenase large subunit n=1 Tax=Thiocapsa sp. TaxID=2024551 RepID=UPI003593F887